MIFFGIKKSQNANKENLIELIKKSKGVFSQVDLLDKNEHNYLEIGGWIGDQGLALKLMGLGACLNLWYLLTPRSVLGSMCDEALANRLAGAGLITIKYKQ